MTIEGKGPHIVACWAEHFEGFHRVATHGEAWAFARGWAMGCSNYGAGKCTTYVLDEETLKAMKEDPYCAKDLAEIRRQLAKAELKVEGWS